MPGHEIHRFFKKALYGSEDMSVDKIMDGPVMLLGKKHREYFHDAKTVVALFGNDPVKMRDAALHILVDQAFTENPKSRKLLETALRLRNKT